uniref:endo-polygalacturonase n=1 Tax=Gastrophysa viridula TaxID=154015 RepID=E7CIY2_GASVI|nr:endopolygalacturonase [Gastrophysa viridula]
MYMCIKSSILFSIVIVGISAETIDYDYETAKNLTSDYCYIKSYNEAPAIVKKCTHIVVTGFEVPAGKTLELNLLQHSVLLFEGTLTFGVAHWAGPFIYITGQNIQVIGGTNHLIHGGGEKYWDGLGGSGVKKPERVFFMNAQVATVKNINIKNCPLFCVSVLGHDLTFSGINIDNTDGFANGLARNTDGITFAQCKNVVLENSKIINQDDGVNILGGCSNVYVRNVHCWGSHGLSVTSGMATTAAKNDVYNVTFEDCSNGGSFVGIHVKTTQPCLGPGSFKQITYKNIQISEVTRSAIEIQQDYPKNDGNSANTMKIIGVDLINVTGSVKTTSARKVRINCGSGSCSNFKWSNVKITGSTTADSCNYHPSGYSC